MRFEFIVRSGISALLWIRVKPKTNVRICLYLKLG